METIVHFAVESVSHNSVPACHKAKPYMSLRGLMDAQMTLWTPSVTCKACLEAMNRKEA